MSSSTSGRGSHNKPEQKHLRDAAIAIALSRLPRLRRWRNRLLDGAVRDVLDRADEQALMSIAARALHDMAQRRDRSLD